MKVSSSKDSRGWPAPNDSMGDHLVLVAQMTGQTQFCALDTVFRRVQTGGQIVFVLLRPMCAMTAIALHRHDRPRIPRHQPARIFRRAVRMVRCRHDNPGTCPLRVLHRCRDFGRCASIDRSVEVRRHPHGGRHSARLQNSSWRMFESAYADTEPWQVLLAQLATPRCLLSPVIDDE